MRGMTQTGWPVVRLLARRTWQCDWRSHAVLAGTVAVVTAVVLSVLIGAQRAESSLSRLRAATHASDLTTGWGDGDDVEDVSARVAAAEGVREVAAVRELFVRPKGSELFPDYQLLAIAPWPTRAGGDVDQPLITAGRAPDPQALDEVALSERYAAEVGLGVGDRFDLESMSFDWIEQAFNGGDPGAPDGPVVRVKVVGLARTLADFGRWEAVIHLTPEFAARYQAEIRTYDLLQVRLDNDLAERVRNEGRVPLKGLGDAEETQPSFFAGSQATQDGLGTIATAMRLIALASALAGVTAVSLMTLRAARVALADRESLVAVGMTRLMLTRLVVAVLAPWMAAGVSLGLVAGVLASPQTSIGLAWLVDPDESAVIVESGWLVAVGGLAALIATVVVVGAALRSGQAQRRGSSFERAVPALARPLAVTLGTRRALFGAPDRGGRASRTAVAAATAGVAVAIAALLVGASIERLESDRALSGQGGAAQRVIDAGEDADVYQAAMATLEDDPRVDDLIGIHVAFGLRATEVQDITALVYDVRRGDASSSVVSGRLPTQPDEVALGPATLEAVGHDVGGELDLSVGDRSARFRIVGEVLFPEGDFQHDSGVALTVGGARFLGGVEGTVIHQVAYAWADGVDARAADRELQSAGFRAFTTSAGLLPPVVPNLGQVRSLPLVLGGLVALLGLVTVAHALTQSTRLRRREVGTLRALGVTTRVTGATVQVHGAVVALLSAAAGVPLGVASGRLVWTQIADRAHVINRPVIALRDVVFVMAAMLIGTAVLAVVPAITSMRVRPGEALRAE